ncbi:hypothetical protein, partial [Escherichia coli]
DRNRSHWSTSKTPSYTKSVSWQHHQREDIISQLEIILSRLKNGENTGFEHDDDFGYSFQYDAAAVGKSSFFDEAAGRK